MDTVVALFSVPCLFKKVKQDSQRFGPNGMLSLDKHKKNETFCSACAYACVLGSFTTVRTACVYTCAYSVIVKVRLFVNKQGHILMSACFFVCFRSVQFFIFFFYFLSLQRNQGGPYRADDRAICGKCCKCCQ